MIYEKCPKKLFGVPSLGGLNEHHAQEEDCARPCGRRARTRWPVRRRTSRTRHAQSECTRPRRFHDSVSYLVRVCRMVGQAEGQYHLQLEVRLQQLHRQLDVEQCRRQRLLHGQLGRLVGRVRLRRTGGAAQITFFAGNGFGFRRKIAPRKHLVS